MAGRGGVCGERAAFGRPGMAAAVYVRLELKYFDWPWRLLRGTFLHEAQKRQLYEEFLRRVPKCCLDDDWGLPMRSRIGSVDEMMTDEFQAMLLSLARNLKATNMSLEGELSEIKAAVPVGKRCPHSERLAYLSHLSFLMKDHLASGRADSRGQDCRAALLLRGGPLEQTLAQKANDRPDTAWRLKRLWQWRQMHPSASAADEAAEVTRIAQQWSGLSDDEKSAANVGTDDSSKVDEHGDCSKVDMCEDEEDLSFDIGDVFWPVRPDVLGSFLHDSGLEGVGLGGVAAKALRLRKKAAPYLLVKDDRGIPDDRTFQQRLSCSQLHAGLCATRDRLVYAQALDLARSLEACLSRKLLHSFVKLVQPGDSGVHLMCFYFARLRARRLHMQCTHCLVRCVSHPDGRWSLAQSRLHVWDFVTPWALARELLNAKWVAVQVVRLRVANRDGASVLPLEDLDAYDVWPALYKRPKAPRVEGPPVDDAVVRRRRPQRHTGGVRLLAPNTVMALAPEDDGVLFADDVENDGDEAIILNSHLSLDTTIKFSNRCNATTAATIRSPPSCHHHHHHHPHIITTFTNHSSTNKNYD